MDKAALLSPTDITVIRRYVHTKYAPLSGPRRAEIVADALRRALRTRLPDLPADLKERLTGELINRYVAGKMREVTPEDVLDVCGNWEQPDDRLHSAIVSWMHERAPGRWTQEQISSRLTRRNIYPTAMLPMPEDLSAEPAAQAGLIPYVRRLIFGRRRAIMLGAAALACTIAGAGYFAAIHSHGETAKETTPLIVQSSDPPVEQAAKPDTGLPVALRYTDIDETALKKYLQGRNAMLAEEPYFEAIIGSARDHDLHPLLLFAITGQEQGFVPKTGKNAKRIANNPFNVFHSWQDYNTDIRDSADIASKLIVKLGNNRPEGHEPFAWINATYAEDPAWGDGVRKIFMKLSEISEYAD